MRLINSDLRVASLNTEQRSFACYPTHRPPTRLRLRSLLHSSSGSGVNHGRYTPHNHSNGQIFVCSGVGTCQRAVHRANVGYNRGSKSSKVWGSYWNIQAHVSTCLVGTRWLWISNTRRGPTSCKQCASVPQPNVTEAGLLHLWTTACNLSIVCSVGTVLRYGAREQFATTHWVCLWFQTGRQAMAHGPCLETWQVEWISRIHLALWICRQCITKSFSTCT